MTYSQFLLVFLVIPGLLLTWVMRHHIRHHQIQVLALLSLVALVYTTPWDNYLVATRVWYYDLRLVLGITLGWVPLEEYLFFLLQPLLGGLWALFVYHWLSLPDRPALARPGLRWGAVLSAGFIWLGALALWLWGWQPGTYLALELAWALPPIALQLAFGADILWHQRRHLVFTLLPLILYFSTADALAIATGIWTINPAFSLQIYLGSLLPVEEVLFFTLTNTLIVFSLGLLQAPESRSRLRHLLNAVFMPRHPDRTP